MSRLNTVLGTIYNLIVNSTTKILKFGTSTNYTQIDTNGRLKNVGNAEMWDDIIGHGVAGTGSAVPPVATVIGNLEMPSFSNVGTDVMFWNFEVLHNTKIVSLADIHFHGQIENVAGAGNAKFDCEYWIRHNGTAMTAGTPLTDTVAIAANSNLKPINFTFTTTLDLSSLNIGDHIIIRITRDNTVASNFAGKIFSYQAGIHRQIDGFGSNERLAKNY